jgi:hypothetical protein
LKPGFFTNEDLAACEPLTRLFFQGLWCLADREGRLQDRPRRLKAEALPYDHADGVAMTHELIEHGFLRRYEVGGTRVLQIVNWSKHQKPHPREVPSLLPAEPGVVEPPHVVEPEQDQGEPWDEPRQGPGHAEQRTSPAGVSFPSGISRSGEKHSPPAREAGAAARAEILHGRDETLTAKHPKTAALLAACAELGTEGAWPKDGSTRAAAEAAIGSQPVAGVAARVVVAIRETGKPWLGHHLPVIRGVSATGPPPRARAPDPRAPAPPSPPGAFHENDAAPWELP